MNINIPTDKKFVDHVHERYRAWNTDGKLYSFALSKVIPFALSGVVWYQGESDCSEEEGDVYCDELCRLTEIWRDDFCDKTLPFVIVKLCDYIHCSNPVGWKRIQSAQDTASHRLSFVTTVESADVCENDCIHPPTKDKLAERISDALTKI